MVCDRCGAELPDRMRFCIRCGAAIAKSASEETPGAAWAVPQIPAASRKSGGVGVVLAAVASVLAVVLGWVLVWGVCQGWFAPEEPEATQEPTQQSTQSEETEPTQPEETEPPLDPSLDAFQWEGMTVYLPRQMYEYCWNVDFMQYSGSDLFVQITSLEITKNRPVKKMAMGFIQQWEDAYLQLELYQEGDVYYARGLDPDGVGVEIIGFYAANDRGYMVSVRAADHSELEEMIRIATTAKMDANVLPRVHTEGYTAYSSTSRIGLDGLVLSLPDTVQLYGHCFDGTVLYQGDAYSVSLYRGDMEEDLGEALSPEEILEAQEIGAYPGVDDVRIEERDGTTYLVCEGADGYLFAMSCFVRDGDYWLVSADSDTQLTTLEHLVQIVTGAELTTGT